MRVRRPVLGDESVDRAEASATALDVDFQRCITQTTWGWVWSRPGVGARTRNLITIAVLAALARAKLEGIANVLDRFNFAAFSGVLPTQPRDRYTTIRPPSKSTACSNLSPEPVEVRRATRSFTPNQLF